ncbi:hypothetical protein [Oligoflexus tunisiensis]|uniref:hypothetical protein n=1 Tax=Oligoflexus tunisiensis TaxID=708132 RepID=UPI00159F0225|nr:hypothetical protein [Oligoflexus tunisiensis]
MLYLHDQFPALYEQLLPDIMQQTIPRETKANCSNCGMTQRDSALGAAQRHLFRADTKCCTYYPRLMNYLVGGLLQDERPALGEGKRRMRERIHSRIGVTPWWVASSLLDQHLYNHAKDSFGKAARLRCPYYASDEGACTIWAYREAVCSTWYCKYEAGKDGLNFWVSLKGYISLVERQLSRYAMLRLDAELVLDDAMNAYYGQEGLTQEQLDGEAPDEALYARLWRQYAGREEEFYRNCYEIVSGLSALDVQKILGLDGRIKSIDVQRKLDVCKETELPDRLKLNPQVTMRWLESGEIALSAYSEYDALALPGIVYPMLVAFDGRQSLAETRRTLQREYQADLADEVLLALYRYRILEKAEADRRPASPGLPPFVIDSAAHHTSDPRGP